MYTSSHLKVATSQVCHQQIFHNNCIFSPLFLSFSQLHPFTIIFFYTHLLIQTTSQVCCNPLYYIFGWLLILRKTCLTVYKVYLSFIYCMSNKIFWGIMRLTDYGIIKGEKKWVCMKNIFEIHMKNSMKVVGCMW